MPKSPIDIFKGSFFQSSFHQGVFIYELKPNVMVDQEMYMEFHNNLRKIYDKIGGQIPVMIKISGFVGIDQAARRLAKLHREDHIAYVSACVTTSHMLTGIMRLIYNVVGSKSLPRDFFTQEVKAFKWLEKKQNELGMKPISEQDVVEKLLAKPTSEVV